MKAYTDHNRHFYLEPVQGILLVRYPKVKFAPTWPRDLQQLSDDKVSRVVEGFLSVARERGGESLAIWYINEGAIMAGNSKNVLVALAGAIAGNYAMEKDAQAAVAKGGALEGGTLYTQEAWDKLSVEERCSLARPLLNDKEKTSTEDGEAFAKNSWKIAQRFKNPKPAKAEKTAAGGKAEKPPKEPRAKGVKTLIREMFTGESGDTLHLSVEEIMERTKGTKPSVTTAISDLRSEKYCGKDGDGKCVTVNLVRVDGKYALEGSSALKAAQEREAKAAQEAEAKKEADKKAKADAKAAEKAAEDKKAKADTSKTTEAAH